MIVLPRAVRVYVATTGVNLKKSFDGLSHEVRNQLKMDPLSGHVFIFLNRKKTMAKSLLWTRGGFTIVAKRLERGTFTFPKRVRPDSQVVEIDAHELMMLLEGIVEDAKVRHKPRWDPTSHHRFAAGGDIA
jgi:transposase